MFRILHIFGDIVSYPIDESTLVGDVTTDRASSYIKGLAAGLAVVIDTDGLIQNVSGVTNVPEGFLVLDAAGNDFENCPALASKMVGVMVGGGIVETDQVVNNDISATDPLYIDATGKLTTDSATDTATLMGYALTSNSASDLTVRVRLV